MRYLNFVNGICENAEILAGNNCFKDKPINESPATLFLVKDMSKELSQFMKEEIPSVGIVEEYYKSYSLVAVHDDYCGEVSLLLKFVNVKFTTFSSYHDATNFISKLDDII